MAPESVQKETKFYFVIVVYESTSDAPDDEPLYEECFMLITAASDEEARDKALRHANQPNSYKNVYGNTVTWTLKQLVDVRPTLDNDDFRDGVELYARFFQNYAAYRDFDASSHPFALNDDEKAG